MDMLCTKILMMCLMCELIGVAAGIPFDLKEAYNRGLTVRHKRSNANEDSGSADKISKDLLFVQQIIGNISLLDPVPSKSIKQQVSREISDNLSTESNRKVEEILPSKRTKEFLCPQDNIIYKEDKDQPPLLFGPNIQRDEDTTKTNVKRSTNISELSPLEAKVGVEQSSEKKRKEPTTVIPKRIIN